MMQSVSVYLRDGKYFVVTIHGSGGGDPCIASGPVKELPADAGPAALGAAVAAGLDASTSNLPWPKDFKKVTEPLLAAAGVKTWSTFAKKAENLRVNREGATLQIMPSTRSSSGSFDPVAGGEQSLASPAAEALGVAVSGVLAAHSK